MSGSNVTAKMKRRRMADCLSASCLLLLFSGFGYFTTIGKSLPLMCNHSLGAYSFCRWQDCLSNDFRGTASWACPRAEPPVPRPGPSDWTIRISVNCRKLVNDIICHNMSLTVWVWHSQCLFEHWFAQRCTLQSHSTICDGVIYLFFVGMNYWLSNGTPVKLRLWSRCPRSAAYKLTCCFLHCKNCSLLCTLI